MYSQLVFTMTWPCKLMMTSHDHCGQFAILWYMLDIIFHWQRSPCMELPQRPLPWMAVICVVIHLLSHWMNQKLIEQSEKALSYLEMASLRHHVNWHLIGLNTDIIHQRTAPARPSIGPRMSNAIFHNRWQQTQSSTGDRELTTILCYFWQMYHVWYYCVNNSICISTNSAQGVIVLLERAALWLRETYCV